MSAFRDFTDALRAKQYRLDLEVYREWQDIFRGAGHADGYTNREARRAIRAYRKHNVPHDFVTAFWDNDMGTDTISPISGHEQAITAYRALRQDGIPDEYILPLITGGIHPDDIARFFGDNIAAEYALAAAAR